MLTDLSVTHPFPEVGHDNFTKAAVVVLGHPEPCLSFPPGLGLTVKTHTPLILLASPSSALIICS
jgi:hypothetical protein